MIIKKIISVICTILMNHYPCSIFNINEFLVYSFISNDEISPFYKINKAKSRSLAGK